MKSNIMSREEFLRLMRGPGKKDLHVHTFYSDGRSSPEETVLSAIGKGMSVIGISDHSYTSFDGSYCMKYEKIPEYLAEISRLKEKYAGRITVLCGVEQDLYGDYPTDEFDYAIGSVHYIRKEGAGDFAVDESADTLRECADSLFGGDIYALTENYYAAAARLADVPGVLMVGHFDLVTKFSERTDLFDIHHPRYRAAWQAAADRLLAAGLPFEINTGAISRGYRTTPYPDPEIFSYLKERGAEFFFSSDSHRAENVCFGF